MGVQEFGEKRGLTPSVLGKRFPENGHTVRKEVIKRGELIF